MKIFKKVFFSLFILIMIFTTINIVCASSITINTTNNTLKNVVNNYDTIYLDDGVYKGISNRNVSISRNTTIVGLNKGGAILDDEYNASLFRINPNTFVTLINLTFRNKISSIDNDGSLTVSNCNFNNNSPFPFQGIISNWGLLRVYDSSFNDNYNSLIDSVSGNDIIKNCEFINNRGGDHGIITFRGDNMNPSLFNLAFYNNSASTGLIVVMGDRVNLNVSNCSFVNTNGDLYAITGLWVPSLGSVIKSSNIIEINTTINYNPRINLEVYLNKNGLMTFKATLKKDMHRFAPNQRLYFYVNGKLVGSALTNKKGVATFNYKRSNLNFTLQVVLNKHTEKTNVRTINYNGASFKGFAPKYIVGSPKVVYKLQSAIKKGKLVYRKYYIYNAGSSFGSMNYYRKIASKYKLVKYSYNNIVFSYNKSKNSFYLKSKNLLPYKFNKKDLGVLILVLKRK